MTNPRLVTPRCPVDGAQLQTWRDGIIDCPHCTSEYVVSVSAARPAWAFNQRAPYAQLVLAVDAALHHRKKTAA
jgi:uncharacterized Zn finger protein (UPF0148 family)